MSGDQRRPERVGRVIPLDAAEARRANKNAMYLQTYGGEPVPPLPAVKIDPFCAAADRHTGCTCNAPPMQPSDYAILRNRARLLGMLGLQSDRFATDPDFRDAVRAVLAVTHVYDAERPR